MSYFVAMNILSNKAKQFLILLIKIAVVSGAFYFIYQQLSTNKTLDKDFLFTIISQKESLPYLLGIALLTFSNRFVEILKWQNLGSLIRKISVLDATKQVLSALTLGIFTPNGIGEYAGKALYFKKKDTGRVIFLNMVCNGIQVIYAIVFGLLGLCILNQLYPIVSPTILYAVLFFILLILAILFSIRHLNFKGYSIQWVIKQLQEIPKSVHRKNFFLAFIRYASFTHQYILLYRLLGVNNPYFELLCAVSCVYLLASSLPNFQFLEFAVKGSIAIYIFNILGVNQWIVLLVATLIWLLNIVLPVTIGSYFVLTFKTKENSPEGDIQKVINDN